MSDLYFFSSPSVLLLISLQGPKGQPGRDGRPGFKGAKVIVVIETPHIYLLQLSLQRYC